MYIEVLVEITNKKLDKTFTYHVPDEYSSYIKKGVRVEVPFQNRTLEGFVLNILNDKPKSDYEIKDIIRVIDEDKEKVVDKYFSSSLCCNWHLYYIYNI